jgi:hypothetical protein
MTRSLLYVACSRDVSEEGLFLVGKFKAPPRIDDGNPLTDEVRRQEENMLEFSEAEMVMRDGIKNLDSV